MGAARLRRRQAFRSAPAPANTDAPRSRSAAAAQRDRHAAHGLNQTIMGCALMRYHRSGASTRCGCRAPTTMPASPRRSSSSASCRSRASAATTWAAKNFVKQCGTEAVWRTITRQMRRMGAGGLGARILHHGRQAVGWSPKPSCACRRGPDLPRQAPGELGPGAENRGLRPRGESGKKLPPWHIAYPLVSGSGPGGGHHRPGNHAGRRGGDGASRG